MSASPISEEEFSRRSREIEARLVGIPHDRVTYAVLFSMAASLSPIYSDLGHAVKIFIDVWSTSNAIVLQRTIQDVLLGEEIAQIPNLPKV